MRRRVLARPRRVALAALVAVSLLSACTGDAEPGGGDSRFVSGSGAYAVVPADKRGAAVNLEGTTLDGDPISLATYRGKPVVLNVWYSTCGPCRKEAPALVQAYEELTPDGVTFVGLNTVDPDPGAAKAFERTFGVPYPTLYDDQGRSLLALRGAVPPNAVPTTLVLDQQGRIAARVSGAVTSAKTLVDLVHDATATS